ncbi:unnamed protein product [Cyclocybe aegerita]|uniref:INO80 complex subunit B-like conserved region domain-containing protein n=1 Tax=Cyclocybe aegerita TaxID=1973307 RepID=A0A8S0VTQ5_CYCAE|nr:unnamed protein product [Cyclocybe aegerita]
MEGHGSALADHPPAPISGPEKGLFSSDTLLNTPLFPCLLQFSNIMSRPMKLKDDGTQSGSVADMQMESEEEEEQVDVEVEDDEQEGEDVEEEDDEDGDVDEESEEEPPPPPRLKITLKLPPTNASSNGTATPDDPEMEYPAYKRTPKRRAKARVIEDADVESEDPMSPSESDEGSSLPSVRPMTTRQAVLASVVDSSHVSLNEGTRSKKQPLNETELALRREETARKRKNLSEKRLEDEKAETINRLLKKQSRPRNKRNNTADDRSPMPTASGSRTPKVKAKAQDGEEGEGEDEEDEDAMDVDQQIEEVKPVMYRWVSSLREVPVEGNGTEKRMEVALTFSVPETLFPPPPPPVAPEVAPEVDAQAEKERAARGPGVCAIAGCGKPRKYRLPRDWTIGACDSIHLRVLANQA